MLCFSNLQFSLTQADNPHCFQSIESLKGTSGELGSKNLPDQWEFIMLGGQSVIDLLVQKVGEFRL